MNNVDKKNHGDLEIGNNRVYRENFDHDFKFPYR